MGKGKQHLKRNAPTERVKRGAEDHRRREFERASRSPKKQGPVVNFYEVALNANGEGGEILRKPSVEVEQPMSEEMFDLCGRLVWVTKHDPNCLGIAAPQVGVPVRIMTMRDNDGTVWCIVNPTVEHDQGALRYSEYEGCFSLPDENAMVERWTSVTVRGLAPSGDPFERKFNGRAARVAQHEMDHLDGVMIDSHGELKPVHGDVISTGETLDAESAEELIAALEAES